MSNELNKNKNKNRNLLYEDILEVYLQQPNSNGYCFSPEAARSLATMFAKYSAEFNAQARMSSSNSHNKPAGRFHYTASPQGVGIHKVPGPPLTSASPPASYSISSSVGIGTGIGTDDFDQMTFHKNNFKKLRAPEESELFTPEQFIKDHVGDLTYLNTFINDMKSNKDGNEHSILIKSDSHRLDETYINAQIWYGKVEKEKLITDVPTVVVETYIDGEQATRVVGTSLLDSLVLTDSALDLFYNTLWNTSCTIAEAATEIRRYTPYRRLLQTGKLLDPRPEKTALGLEDLWKIEIKKEDVLLFTSSTTYYQFVCRFINAATRTEEVAASQGHLGFYKKLLEINEIEIEIEIEIQKES